jgi:hypothetical protein
MREAVALLAVAACTTRPAPPAPAAPAPPPAPRDAAPPDAEPPDEGPIVEYRGEILHEGDAPHDRDCTHAPNRLTPASTRRAAALLRAARIEASYPSDELIGVTLDLRVPDFCLTIIGPSMQDDGTPIMGYAFEIPGSDEERILTFLVTGDTVTLLDDVVTAVDFEGIHLIDHQLEYRHDGHVVMTRTPMR